MLDIRRIYRYKSLLRVLTTREVRGRYRGSALGVLWTLVNPLLLTLVYTFVFTTIFQPRDAGMSPYALFLVCGLFPWVWISSAMLESASSITSNAGLIQRSVFPVELLPLVPVLTNLVNFTLSLPILLIGLVLSIYLGYDVGGWAIALLPLVMAVTLVMLSGLCLALGALTAHFKDIRDILANLITLLFFTSPIIYSVESIAHPVLRNVIQSNPFSPFVVAFQGCLFHGAPPDLGTWVHMFVVAAVAWFSGSFVFDRLSETLAEAV